MCEYIDGPLWSFGSSVDLDRVICVQIMRIIIIDERFGFWIHNSVFDIVQTQKQKVHWQKTASIPLPWYSLVDPPAIAQKEGVRYHTCNSKRESALQKRWLRKLVIASLVKPFSKTSFFIEYRVGTPFMKQEISPFPLTSRTFFTS